MKTRKLGTIEVSEIDDGCTASYHYGDLQYLKATH